MTEHEIRELLRDVERGRPSRRPFVQAMVGLGLPLAQRAKAAAMSSRLRGVETNPYDLDVWNIADWYRES